MRYLLLLWLACLGADRVDFGLGNMGFTITPFIFISAVIFVSYFFSNLLAGRLPTFKLDYLMHTRALFILICCFLGLILLSVLFGNDLEFGAKRYVLLCYQVFFCFFVTYLLVERNDKELVVRGACLGILLFLLFDILQLIVWFSPSFADAALALRFVDLVPPSYGQIAPRPSGFTLDMNRGGFMLVFFFFCIMSFGRKTLVNRSFLILAFALLLVTFSRSAILAFLIFFGSELMRRRRVINWKGAKYYLFVLVILFGAMFFATKDQSNLDVETLLLERTSFSSGDSGGEHQELVVKGIETAATSWKTIAIGVGFGSSYTVLGDFFGAYKNGNFHSLYITILAESGVLSLMVFLMLLVTPMFLSRPFFSIMLSLIIFNVSYLLLLDPVFWVLIVWSWVNLFSATRRIGSTHGRGYYER